MATVHVRGPRGNAPHPITGDAYVCGPDDTTYQGHDDTGDGSEGNPYLTLDQSFINNQLDPGDILRLGGRIRLWDITRSYACQIFDQGGNITIEQHPDWETAVIRGDQMPGKTKANNLTADANHWLRTTVGEGGTNGWKIVCDGSNGKLDLTGQTVVAVSFDWDDTLNIEAVTGARKSYFAVGANVAAIAGGTRGVQGKWFQSGTTLYVLMPTFKGDGTTAQTDDPTSANANGIEITLTGKTGISVTASGGTITNQNLIIKGESSSRKMRVAKWGAPADTAPFGAGINYFYSQNCAKQDVIFEDSGDHAWALGAKVINATVTRCDVNGGMTGCYYAVFNASGGGNSASGQSFDGTWYAHSLLGHNGVTVDRSSANVGAYVHGPHTSIVWKGMNITLRTPLSGTPDALAIFASDNGTAPTNLLDTASYPVLVDACTVNGSGYWSDQGITSYIGYRRCHLGFSQQNAISNGFAMELQSFTGRWNFDACEIIGMFKNDNGATNCAMFRVGVKMVVRLTNCSCYDNAASHANGKTYSFFHMETVSKTIDQITAAATPVIRTTAAHGLGVGSTVTLSSTNSTPPIDGTYVVATVSDSTHFTVTGAPSTVGGAGTTGSLVGSGTVYAEGCDFGYRAIDGATAKYQVVSGNSSLAAAAVQFTSCRYFNCGYQNAAAGNFWSDNTAYDSAAEWLALDTGGGSINNLKVSTYSDATGATLAPTTAAKAVRKYIANHALTGLNGPAYSMNYGAYQYGGATYVAYGMYGMVGYDFMTPTRRR